MISQKQVDYAVEVNNLLDIIVKLVEDVKAKKTGAEIAADLFISVIPAVAGIAQLGPEVAQNPKVVAETVGYRLGDVISALV